MSRQTVDNEEYFRKFIRSLLKQMGRNFTICEQCKVSMPENKSEVHHTKYEGATIYDLQVVCRKCNKAGKNIGLI